MKKNENLLIILILLFSFISWILGSIFISFLWWNKILEKEKTKTIIKNDLQSIENNITEIAKEVSPSVVNIIIKKDLVVYRNDPYGFFQQKIGSVRQKIGGGTGFFITKDGEILTNKHVVSDESAEYTVITNSWKEYDAKILALDPLTDLAVIKIQSEESFIPLEFIKDSHELTPWEFVIAIGNALAEFQNSISLWVISGLWRTIKAENETLAWLIQTDAAINPWNSGWPLVNLNKKVVGINTAILDGAEGIGFALELSQKKIDYIINSIEKYGKIKKPIIGINYILMTPELAKELGIQESYWAYILNQESSILSWSSAEKAWLQKEDIILEINDIKIDSQNTLESQIQNKIPWEKIQLTVKGKNGKIKNISITLSEY
jgi:serine protease Do